MNNDNNCSKDIATALNQIAILNAYKIINNENWIDESKHDKIVFLHNSITLCVI